MFGLYSKLSEFVWGCEETEDTNSQASKRNLREKKTVSKGITDDVGCSRFSQNPKFKKEMVGKVTRLYDGAGLIDDEVYFTFDKVIGGERPEVGTEVLAEAFRESEMAGWRAVRVQVMSEWKLDENEKPASVETLIGSITNITHDSGVVDNEISFKMSCVRQGYVPFSGDWVKLDVDRAADGTIEVTGVMPLREKNFTGVVTYVSCGVGYIDGEVYFTCGVCSRGYRPRKGDTIKTTAIESKQGKAVWRAIKVEPIRTTSSVLSPSLRTQQFMGGKMAELLSNKEGIVITDQLDIGEVHLGESRMLIIWISNQSERGQIFQSCTTMRQDDQFSVQLSSNDHWTQLETTERPKGNETVSVEEMLVQGSLLAPDMEIPANQAKQTTVMFNAKNLGRVNHLLVFAFNGFEIGRYITADVRDPQQAILKPCTPYQRPYSQTNQAQQKVANGFSGDDAIIPGEKTLRKRKLFLPVKLGQYNIPRDIRRCILEGRDLGTIVQALREPLSLKNYAARFSTLLYAEELQMEIDMRQFDIDSVSMNVCGEYLSLQIPGLAEGRPSLLLGDKVIASLTGSSSDAPKYEGFIHEVRKDDILLKFNEEFHNRFAMQDCDVMFCFNRTTLRRAHRAVEFALSLGEPVLFPRKLSPKLPVFNLTTSDLPTTEQCVEEDFLYNSSLNERQRAAVCRIVSGQCRPSPYLLFGPPGTGKTITVVEAILQIFRKIPSGRVLACAPSNSAADLIAERLHRSGFVLEGDMVRLNAIQRVQDIPESIARYCTDTDHLDTAAHYRIIISTCSTAGQLYSLGLRAGHITHVFVDEAGQATEPECLVAVGLAAGDDGQVILAGDPFQLGPVLQSRVASSFGLNISLLERLINRPLYYRNEAKFSDHGCYDPLLVTKLVNNYRSHPAVLKLPSAVFYHDELVPCANECMRESLCHWEKLPKKGFPVVFHGVQGEDLREGNSPSWFNPVEAVQVVKYLQALKSSDKLSIKLSDVGIITPYRKQVEKTRLLLASVGLDEVKVGSVEEFQGQERLVIIISTVRSNASLVGSDVRHTIGFLSNPKRFNVAITRAQALLIVIGNPHVLCQDPYWCCLVQYCVVNDSYIGCDLPSLDQHFVKEEFDAASNLLSNILLKHEINRNGDFTEDKSNSVLQDLNQSSNCTQAISNESNMLSCNGEDISLVSEPQEQIESSSSNNTQTSNKGGTLTMRKKPFAGPSVSSRASPTLTKEPQQLCVSSEVLSDSDDELEQFVLQPKGRRQKNIKL
ncbi:RNA helicase Mov10l1-like isoform X2 [Acropora palmata]|uniref:RNA helicase Mov10l1-like isoform X2 n=1 Tax=Acropora palmata TaxID=6131 RepID=UPI003DA0574F